MDSLYTVVLVTVALAAACIFFSTWTTIGDLRQIVTEAQAAHHQQESQHHDWHEFATRAIGHIEHIPYDQVQAHASTHQAGKALTTGS